MELFEREFALGMVQKGRLASTKVVRTMLFREEFVRGMGQ